jgi:hypothetical protein
MAHRMEYIVGIVFALMFIAILSRMNLMVTEDSYAKNVQLAHTFATTEMFEMQEKNKETISGANIISLINNSDLQDMRAMDIIIENEDDSITYKMGEGYTVVDTKDEKYINPLQSFSSELIKNDYGKVVSIKFIPVEETEDSEDAKTA